MKAKSKVLLGLIVALAMMVFAVPAFATTVTTPTPATQKVYVGSDASFKFTINDGPATGNYDVKFEDAVTPNTAVAFQTADFTVTPATIAGQTAEVTVTVKTNGTGDQGATTVGKHAVTYTVTDSAGVTASDTVEIEVEAAPTVKLTGYDDVAAAQQATVTQLTKASLKAGDPIGLHVVKPEGNTIKYQWQKASTKGNYTDPADKNWKNIDGANTVDLNTAATIEDNGQYVRCVVDIDGKKVVADAQLAKDPYAQLEDQSTVQLTVSDSKKITLTTKDITAGTTADKAIDVKSNYEFFNGAKDTNGVLKVQVTPAGGSGTYAYEWQKDGKSIMTTAPTGVTVNTNTITFTSVTDVAKGTYQCVVKNSTDDGVSAKSPAFTVGVKDTPTMVVEEASVSQTEATYIDSSTNPPTPDITKPTAGQGTVAVKAEDMEKALTLTAKADGMEPTGYLWYKWDGTSAYEAIRTGNGQKTYTIPAGTLAATDQYKVEVSFKDIEEPLEFVVKFKTVSGTLDGGTNGVLTSKDGAKTFNPNPVYTVTLPAGYNFPSAIANGEKKTAANWKDSGLTINPIYDDTTSGASGINVKILSVTPTTTETGVAKMTFQHEALSSAVTKPVVGDMEVVVTGAIDVTAPTDTTKNINVNLPVSKDNGYKITLPVSAQQLEIKDPEKTAEVTYTGKPVEVTVGAKDDVKGVGEISNVRYGKTTQTTTPITPTAAEIAAASTTAPTDADKYFIVCDVADGTQYSGAKDVVLSYTTDYLEIKPANLATISTADPDATMAYFEIAPEKVVFDNKEHEPKVSFADGVEKAGVIDKVKYYISGTTTEVTPKSVGKYDVMVTTKTEKANDDANVGNTNGTFVKAGVFEITKTEPTKDLYTMTPESAVYDGLVKEPKITAKEGAGKVEDVHYYAEGDDTKEVEPIEAGKYTVKVDVAESDAYAAKKGLEIGTFTITKSASEQPTIYTVGHVENIGWGSDGKGKLEELKPGGTVDMGTTGQGLRVEAMAFIVPEDYKVIGFAHVENEGDVAVKEVKSSKDYEIPEGYVAYEFGSTGKGQRVEAVCVGLQDASGEYVKGFQYAVHLQNYGWQGFVRNGSFSGTRGMGLRMESIRFTYADPDVVKAGTPEKDS